MNYLAYWSLKRKPFASDDANVWFAGVAQREAMAGVNYLIASDMNLAFFVAQAGCGMSHLFRKIASMQGFGDFATQVVHTDSKTPDQTVQTSLLNQLGYPNQLGDVADNLTEAVDLSARQGMQVVWLADRVSRTAIDVASDMLSKHKNFNVVVGIGAQEYRQRVLKLGRTGVRIDLEPMTCEETGQYIHHCLRHAGASKDLFPDNTKVRLWELSHGVISDLAWLAESSLKLAAIYQMDQISPAVIEAAQEQRQRVAA